MISSTYWNRQKLKKKFVIFHTLLEGASLPKFTNSFLLHWLLFIFNSTLNDFTFWLCFYVFFIFIKFFMYFILWSLKILIVTMSDSTSYHSVRSHLFASLLDTLTEITDYPKKFFLIFGTLIQKSLVPLFPKSAHT